MRMHESSFRRKHLDARGNRFMRSLVDDLCCDFSHVCPFSLATRALTPAPPAYVISATLGKPGYGSTHQSFSQAGLYLVVSKNPVYRDWRATAVRPH